jgi:hypothetical protein
MNRSVAKRPRKPAAKKRAAGGGTPAWFRDPVPGDIIEVVATDEAGFLVWKAAQVDGVLVGSIPLRSFNVRWRWPKTGRPPHGGGEIEVFASHGWRKEKVSATVGDPVREFWTWECSHILVADEGWLWRWPADLKPEPAVRPTDRVPQLGDTIHIITRPREASYAAKVDRSERFPGRGGARFCIQGMGSWFYQDERGTFWDWQPPDTGTVQKAAAAGETRFPAHAFRFDKAVHGPVDIVDVTIPFDEIRRLVDAPPRAEIRLTGSQMLLVTWKRTPEKETT